MGVLFRRYHNGRTALRGVRLTRCFANALAFRNDDLAIPLMPRTERRAFRLVKDMN